MDHKKLQGQLNKELGAPGLVTSLTEREKVKSGLSSGSMLLNFELSGSPLVGYAWGRMVELYGPEQSGKTTFALHAILEAQKLEAQSGEAVPALFVDAEHALDVGYAENIGIDMGNLSISQPDFGEQALDVVESAIATGYKLIVVDSVAALTPEAEIEGEMGDSHMGLQARLMSQACRKLGGKLKRSGGIIIWINQIRTKIGIVFGNPEVTTGGNALKFWTSYRLEIRSPRAGAKKGKMKLSDESEDEQVELGTIANIKVVKNKLYPPYRKASIYIEYGVGIDKYRDAADFLRRVGAFKKKTVTSGKSKGKTIEAINLPSKKKSYQYSGLLKVLPNDADVQKDVTVIIKKIDEGLK